MAELLVLVDVVCTNSRFPALFSPDKSCLQEQMLALLQVGRAHTVITTLGAQGSVLLRRKSDDGTSISPEVEALIPEGILSHTEWTSPDGQESFDIWRCKAWTPCSIQDPTGAGDAFIAGVIHGILARLPPPQWLLLGSKIASDKLALAGARAGIPRKDELPAALLCP
mmetsp:Transcript_86888/g.127079  ORF Transcript_86888/g.127079 Transcript_86888/m.127079 type:complete len:168 (+) Transcript_86888:250-753(+)